MSQAQLASVAELDRTYISALENGKKNATVSSLLRIAEALEIELRELLPA